MKQGINIKPEIVYQEEGKRNSLLAIVWDLFVLLLLQVGVMEFARIWIQMEQQRAFVLFLVVALTGLFTIVAYRCFRFRYTVLIPIGVALGAAVVNGFGSAYYGLFGFINYLISYWNIRYEDGISLFMENSIQRQDIEAFILVLALLITAYFWYMLRKKSLVRIWIVPMCFILSGLVLDQFSTMGCSVFLIGWLGVWLSKVRTRASYRRLIWLITISVLMIGTAILSGKEKLPEALQVKEQAKEIADEIRNGKDTLPQGDLSKAAGLLTGDKKTLQVTTGQEKSLYLKGFVGSRYENGKWSDLPKSAYKGTQSGMLQWLADSNFVPQNQYADYISMDNKDNLQKNKVQIQNVGANRAYIYEPYSTTELSGIGIQTNKDINYISNSFFGKRNYQFEEWSGNKPGELLFANSWVENPKDKLQQQYAKAENVYANFVYSHYLEIDTEMADMIDQVFFDQFDTESEQTIYDVTVRIRDVLEKKAVYRKQPKIAPEGTEPISWFLNKGHEGNAVLFASAAVEAYRVKGIPARYVEGYLVTQEQAAASGGNVTLTNQDSHAWVEVYLDGVGWVPIDVTPGFYYDTYTLLQMVQRPQNVNQTAATDDSDQQGNQIEDETNKADKTQEQKKKEPVRIVIDGVVYVLFVCILLYALLEISYVLAMAGMEKRYAGFSGEKQTKVLIFAIYRMMEIYGYQTKLGWNAEEVDALLADRIPQFFPGEYIRVTRIMERHIYGQQELKPQENGVLYVFAVRLYEARKNAKVGTRIRIRYFFMNPVNRAMLSQQK